jgi:hypothetical protein
LAVAALAAEKPYYPKPAYPAPVYPSYEKSYDYVKSFSRSVINIFEMLQ